MRLMISVMFLELICFVLFAPTTLAIPWGSWNPPLHRPSPSSPSAQSPFHFPLPNGFPNISIPSSALTEIEQQAHGTLPNSQLPSEIANVSEVVFEIIAFNELFEVAFFTSLINNITNNVPGYVPSSDQRSELLETIRTIRAQEELHALGANAILATAGREPIQPCQYIFPTSDLSSALAFASTFTDIVLGTLQEALTNFGLDGDFEFINLISSIIGQEGEQDGFFRIHEHKVPSALPFLTMAAGAFAYSALNQMVVVPGSCPNAKIIPVPIFGALDILTPNIGSQTTCVEFRFNKSATAIPASGLSLVYINQQNLPVVESLGRTNVENDMVTFTADFPYAKYEMNGLTLAAITRSPGPFANASDVAMSALFGPGIIEIN